MVDRSLEEELGRRFDGLQLAMLKNIICNSKGSPASRTYTNNIKELAPTLEFYSPKAYKYLRSIIPLLHPSLIRKWARNVSCESGFLGESFFMLETKGKPNGDKKDCCLVIDAMAICKQTQWEPANK